MTTGRKVNARVVEETECDTPERLAACAGTLCEAFGPEALVVTLLTDATGEGDSFAAAFIHHVVFMPHHQALQRMLHRLPGVTAQTPRRARLRAQFWTPAPGRRRSPGPRQSVPGSRAGRPHSARLPVCLVPGGRGSAPGHW